MPRFIGREISGSTMIDDVDLTPQHVRLTFFQAQRLPPRSVLHVLDTSDTGFRRVYAKRWFRWYALAQDVLSFTGSTPKMIRRASLRAGTPIVDRFGVIHAPSAAHPRLGRVAATEKPVDCMTCLVLEARGG